MFTINRNPDADDLRKFGWAMLVGFGAIGLVLWVVPWWTGARAELFAWSGSGRQITAVCLWGLGVVLWAVSLLSPAVARPIYVGWMSVVVPIGIFVSTVLLTILFVLLLPAFSLLVRMGDPLRKKPHPGGSYWEDYKPHEATLERMRRPF